MALMEALLAVALGLPAPWYRPAQNPETTDQYRERLGVIVEAVAAEAQQASPWPYGAEGLAIATLTLWEAESALSLEVHANTGKDPWGQDYGKARCLGQIHSSRLVPKDEWEQLAGIDLAATRRCASATMRLLRAQYWVCHKRSSKTDPIASMYELYASGRSCVPKERSLKRSKRYRDLLAQLYVERGKARESKEVSEAGEPRG